MLSPSTKRFFTIPFHKATLLSPSTSRLFTFTLHKEDLYYRRPHRDSSLWPSTKRPRRDSLLSVSTRDSLLLPSKKMFFAITFHREILYYRPPPLHKGVFTSVSHPTTELSYLLSPCTKTLFTAVAQQGVFTILPCKGGGVNKHRVHTSST